MRNRAWRSIVDGIVAGRQGTHAPPGAVLAVLEGEAQHVAASGFADVRTGEAMTTAHAFDLASVSKVLTTLALRRLIADGSLADDTTIGRVLGPRAGAAGAATIDDALRHRAGLTEWWPLYLVPGATDDPVAAALRLPPRYAPGAGRHYSDVGMQALGAVAASVSGLPLAAAIRQLVLDPIGAATISPAAPAPELAAAAGPAGDAIEREMVQSGVPYPVGLPVEGFAWRTRTLTGEVADGNAFHAFGGVAGHAGWFSDAAGLLKVAAAIADPAAHGFGDGTGAAFATALDRGQGQGLLHYRLRWRGVERRFVGHSGFTGTLVAAAPATQAHSAVLTAMLSNRLHGRPAPTRDRLASTEALWRDAMAEADALLHPSTAGAP